MTTPNPSPLATLPVLYADKYGEIFRITSTAGPVMAVADSVDDRIPQRRPPLAWLLQRDRDRHLLKRSRRICLVSKQIAIIGFILC